MQRACCRNGNQYVISTPWQENNLQDVETSHGHAKSYEDPEVIRKKPYFYRNELSLLIVTETSEYGVGQRKYGDTNNKACHRTDPDKMQKA